MLNITISGIKVNSKSIKISFFLKKKDQAYERKIDIRVL